MTNSGSNASRLHFGRTLLTLRKSAYPSKISIPMPNRRGNSVGFLDDRPSLPLKLAVSTDLQPKRLILGNGSNALEVAICESMSSPTAGSLRHAWRTRLDSRATPLLLVALYNGRAALCGPAGDPPPTLSGSPNRAKWSSYVLRL